MATARDFITKSVKLLGALRKGEALSADEAADGLESLNDLLGTWSNESLLITSRVWEYFTVASALSYTIGVGQSLNTVRPILIKSAFFRIGSIDHPLEIITDEEYESIQLKTLSGGFPAYLSIDNAYPYGTIRLYPQGAGELHLLSEKPLTEIASLNSTIDLAPGTKRAIKSNLVMDLASEYEIEPSTTLVKMAIDSKAALTLAVAKNRPIKRKPSNVSTGNIYNGWTR